MLINLVILYRGSLCRHRQRVWVGGVKLDSSGTSIRSSERVRSVRILHAALEKQQRRFNILHDFSLTSTTGSTDTFKVVQNCRKCKKPVNSS